MSRLTVAQARGHAVRSARAERRWMLVQRVSDEGGTLDDAAARADLTLDGLRSMLYRKKGSWTWPVK